jgi:hypothetical protein
MMSVHVRSRATPVSVEGRAGEEQGHVGRGKSAEASMGHLPSFPKSPFQNSGKTERYGKCALGLWNE